MKKSSPALKTDFKTFSFIFSMAITYVKERSDNVAETRTKTSIRLIISSKFLELIDAAIRGIKNPIVSNLLR